MLLFGLFMSLYCATAVSSYNMHIKDLPKDVSEQLKNFVTSPSMHLPIHCRRRHRVELQYLLYNRENPNNPIGLNATNPQELKNNKDIKILIHGWLASPKFEEILELKNAYLQQYDCNVVIINWSKYAMEVYQTSYCYAGSIGHVMAKILCTWNKKIDIDLDKVHILGHSMGAHIAGLVGHYTVSMCKVTIGRITGLDPSKAIYNNPDKNMKLSKSNAKLVDIIYTDNSVFGIEGRHGDLNFYPNCGQRQPGCPTPNQVNDDDLLSDVMCNQIRSLEYMTESISQMSAIAVSCASCPRFCRPDIISESYMPMGEGAMSHSHRSSSYMLRTYSTSPYFTAWQKIEI